MALPLRNVRYEIKKNHTKDCCSGKTVYKYKLTLPLTSSTIDRNRTLDTFTFEIHNGRFMLSADQGRTTLTGTLNRPHLRIVLIQPNPAFITSIEHQLGSNE